MKKQLNERFQELAGIKPLIQENKGRDTMLAFLKATEKAPNQDEILEKFEEFIESFAPGIFDKVAKFTSTQNKTKFKKTKFKKGDYLNIDTN